VKSGLEYIERLASRLQKRNPHRKLLKNKYFTSKSLFLKDLASDWR